MKVGKTSLASQIDKVLIAGFEQGTNAIHNVLVQPIAKWNDWKQVVRQLVRDKDKLQEKISVVAIDTVDEAYKLCEKFVCQQNGIEAIREIPFGGGYKLLDDEFSSTFRELTFAGYGLVFISHSKDKTLKDDRGQEYSQITPALPDRPFNIINKMVDIIGYLRQIDVQENDEIIHKRFLFFRGDDRFYAGSRFTYIVPRIEIPYEKDGQTSKGQGYKTLLKAINDAIDKEVEAKGGGEATEESNPYLRLDYDTLMEDAKALWLQVIDKGKVEEAQKLLEKEFGKTIKFSEIPSDQVEAMNRVLGEIKEIL